MKLVRIVRDRTDICAPGLYNSPMSNYTFRTRQGEGSNRSVASDWPDDGAARREAEGMFADMARDVADSLEKHPEWQMEVADESGKTIFRLSLLAESIL
jgi:hypothetical protein